jgi:serine/threonine-protein kinase
MTSPKKIGRYEVVRELGRGGMATIYAAHDPLTNRDVAIKVLPVELMQDPNFRTRFQREAQVIAALEHPAIVPVYDFGEESGQPYFVMRLMAGRSLAERIAEGPLSLESVAYIFSRIAPALDEAHAKGIIHRDLKPANILFDHHGDPYISDFGIAKLSEGSTTLTGNSIVGTPAYMSPEQGRGESDIDGRSDIYSMGAIFYEMLTCQPPYEADSPTGLVLKHITSPIPNILDANPDLPPECQEVIVRSMAKRKFGRFNKASELSAAVNAIVAGHPMKGISATMAFLPETTVSEPDSAPRGAQTPRPVAARAKTPPPGRSTPPPARRPSTPGRSTGKQVQPKPAGRGGWVVGVVLVAVLLAVGGYFAVNFFAAPPTATPLAMISPTATMQAATQAATQTQSPTSATVQTEKAPPPTSLPTPSETPLPPTDTPIPLETATPEPVGPAIGNADKVAFIKENDIWVANLDGSGIRQLTTTGGIKSNPQWVPDGSAITYIRGKCVEMVTLDGKPAITQILCASWSSYLAAFEISPNGLQVALSLSDGLFVYPYDLTILSQIRRQDQLQTVEHCLAYTKAKTRTVRWSNDSTRIAMVVTSTEGGRQVEVVRVIDISQCPTNPKSIDEFPGTRFSIQGYDRQPAIEILGWDGDSQFVVGIDALNGFGQVYLYNLGSHNVELLKPLGNNCCFRDFRWSPDNNYLMFAFQDNRYAKETELYLIDFNTLGSGAQYQPIPFPDLFFVNRLEKPQAVLRPVRP